MNQLNKKPTFLENVDMMVSETINAIDVDPNIAKILQTCRSTLQVKFPVRIKGKTEIFFGWRAIHSTHRLPAKGGLRFATEVNQEEIEYNASNNSGVEDDNMKEVNNLLISVDEEKVNPNYMGNIAYKEITPPISESDSLSPSPTFSYSSEEEPRKKWNWFGLANW